MAKGRSESGKPRRRSKSGIPSSSQKDLVPQAKVTGGDGAVSTTMITNLANMRHESLKAVANNLRA
jgi:hypothetical protein